MKYHYSLLVFAIVALSACKKKANADTNIPVSPTETEVAVTNPSSASISALEKIPMTTMEVGEFPYISSPTGYRHADEKTKTLEEKYFFYPENMINKVEGKYYHTTVYQQGDVFEDTYLVSQYKNAIGKLGGVEVYSGGLPSPAGELIDKEQPAYAEDMYDPRAYKYKQFVIRTADENIWIEICHGLNADQIDLTVIREETGDQ